MGSFDDDRKQPNNHHSQIKYKLKILLLIIITNLFTIYMVINHLPHHAWDNSHNTLLHELNATKLELQETHSRTITLHDKLTSTNLLVEKLLSEISRLNEDKKVNYDDFYSDLSDEAKYSIASHKLPLGFSPRVGSDAVYPPVGGGCLRFKPELEQYMSYNVGGECPVDDVFAQKFMLKGCEPLPRRRCHPKSPVGYVEPFPLPDSLWTVPSDTSIVWDPYTCKNYSCLVERKKIRGYYDCKDCFDLKGREKTRWLVDNGGLDYGIDQILGTRKQGTIRIGLDIGGGSGTFAARMKERNITIITTSMNLDGPFNNFIASRGLISMHISVFQRLPFFENTLDIVHSMHVLSNWIPNMLLEFTLYDIYRVLRPGGIFWVDRFFCFGNQLNSTYVPMFNRVGFKKLRWNVGMKFDRGVDKNEWYFSALLEKPRT